MRIHRFLAIVLTALALTMTSAHVHEMPQKMSYSLGLYTAVNSSLYRYFAIFGGIYEIAAILAVGTLAWRARRQRSAYWVLAAAIGVALAFLAWLVLVEPANLAAARGTSWADLRGRWEYGHLVGFIFMFLGLIALVVGTVLEIPVTEPAVHVEVSRVIHAPPERLLSLYLDYEGWPRVFPATIRDTRHVASFGSTTTLDVEHAKAGTVRNVVTVTKPREVVLDESRPDYQARFVNRFDPHPDGCRYTVVADVAPRGARRFFAWLAEPFVRARVRRSVLAPMQRSAEAA